MNALELESKDLTTVPDSDLNQLTARIEEEWRRRRTETDPSCWECGECGYRDPNSDKVHRHLISNHRYPTEDADLATKPIYIR